MSERSHLNERLDRLEADFVEVLKAHGFPLDVDAYASNSGWAELQGCVPNLVEKGKWRNLLLT